jgi:molybdenum cofactor guanylyltransferase
VPRRFRTVNIEACILLGGLSQRMGRDKAALRLDRRTLTSHIRAAAESAGLRVRIFRRDNVTRCGPLGGILTALRRGSADAYLFLACDMPFITERLLRRIIRASRDGNRAVFTASDKRTGFPCLIPRSMLNLIEEQRIGGEFSIRSLAASLNAASACARGVESFNINTPDDLEAAKLLQQRRVGGKFPRDNK